MITYVGCLARPGTAGPSWADLLAQRLARLGQDGRSGSLHVAGRRGGEIFLVDGRVVAAEAPTVCGVEVLLLQAVEGSRPGWETLARNGVQQARAYARSEATRLVTAGAVTPIRLEALVQSATLDAVHELSRIGGGEPAGMRFRSGQRHWAGAVRPLTVAAVTAETARRDAILQQIGERAGPDRVLARATRLPLQRLRLTAAQWDLVRAVDGASTVTALAWVIGRGLFATTLEAYGLVRLGVLETVTPAVRAPLDRQQDPVPGGPGRRRPELSFGRGHHPPPGPGP